MSDIMNCIRRAGDAYFTDIRRAGDAYFTDIRRAGDAYFTDIRNKADFKKPVDPPSMNENDMANTITLDLRLDPDPYGYHSIPLQDRLFAMGWPVTQQ